MPTNALAIDTLGGAFPSEFEVLTWEAGDVANGNHYAATGREILLAWNTSADTNYDVTITGEPDYQGRDANLVDEIAFGTIAAVLLGTRGWRNASREVVVTVENAAVKLAVLRLPTGR